MNTEDAVEYARALVRDIISFFGSNVAVDADIDDEVIQIKVASSSLNSLLIGRNSENLRSLQYIVSMALREKDAETVRVNIDVAGYKEQRAGKIEQQAAKWFDQVRRTGEPYTADLNAADRRTVHKLAQDSDDIETHSEGEGRERRLIISKK